MAKLTLRGDQGDREIPLEDGKSVTIGRSPECDLPIEDNQASRRHCAVQPADDGGWEAADLGSTNGTLVNSTLVKKQKLYDGDVIRIGACEIAYADPEAVRSAGGGSDNCTLVYAKGSRKGEEIELTEQRTTLGRKNTNTVVLDDTVASSYPCESARDLNASPLRDLGSTNGTLLNNEMITEAPLTHGARIRVGNTRFVFQDPAMSAVDLDLAGADEEDEWGMMRDLDLAAVRKRNPATVIYAVLFVGILGAGAWFMTQEPAPAESGPVAPQGNLHASWSFEDGGAEFTWDSEPPDTVAFSRSKSVKGRGEASLELRPSAPETTAVYSTSVLGAEGRRYELTGKVAARGDTTARLGLEWRGSGLSAWVLGPAVDSGSLKPVTVEASAPPWAGSVRLGVRMEGEGRVYLDDVALVPAGRADVASLESRNFRAAVTDGRRLMLSNSGVPVLFDGRPVAENEAGEPVGVPDLTVAVQQPDEQHLLVTVEGAPENAARVGIRVAESNQYLSRGGFRAFGDKEDGSTYFVSTFPGEGTTRLERVRKLLVGPPGRACAVIGATDGGRIATVATVGERRTWTILGPARDGSFSFRVKTDLTGDATEAARGISNSLSLYEQGRWGDFLRESDRVLAEFPFANESMRRRLARLGREVRAERDAIADRIEALLQDYDEFKDLKSLDDVEALLKTLREKFQIEPGEGIWGERVAKWAGAVERKREAALRERQAQRAEERMALSQYVFEARDPPAVHSAAVVYAYIKRYLGEAPAAQKARAALQRIKENHPGIKKVLGDLFGEAK